MAATSKASMFLFILSCFACSCVTSTVESPVVRHDLVNPVTNPVTNPAAITPPLAPAIVTVPAVGVTPYPPGGAAQQGGTGAIPVTNPVTTPSGGVQPVTNPVTTPTPNLTPPTTIPNPYPTTNAPPTASAPGGQSWCVAKSGVPQTSLQSAIDYACGMGGADCSAIQQGGSCYNPNTLQNHASFAFNSYYQKNPVPTSCDFSGTAIVTNQNPSTGSCVYPTSSASGTPSTMPTTTTPSSTMPTTTTPSSTMPTTTTPSTMPTTTTPSYGATVPGTAGTGALPNVLNSTTDYPPLGGGTGTGTTTGGIIGASPPSDGSYISLSNHLQAYVGPIALVASIITSVLIVV